MADYYSILARAASRLAPDDARARRELYERAAAILVAQLRKKDPPISALGVIGEQIALQAAILKIEAESRSMPARCPETFAKYIPTRDGNDILDFASLLRAPPSTAPRCNNIRLVDLVSDYVTNLDGDWVGKSRSYATNWLKVSPPPSRLIPKKFVK
jgi:hypothetical protein